MCNFYPYLWIEFIKHIVHKLDMKCTYNVTLRHFLSVTVAVQKQ